MSSVIRIGTVSKVNYEDGTIEVAYEDRDGSVTDEICVVSNALYRMPVLWFAFSTIPIVRKWERASERSGMRITSRSVERNNVTGMTTTIRRAKPLNNTMEIAETMKKKSTGMQKRPSVKIWTSLLVGT